MRDLVFDRVMVDFLVRGQARVSWKLFYQFRDPGPFTFQVQVGGTPLANADDWQNVGAPVVNAAAVIDPQPRVFGTAPRVHYRVRLTTPRDVYVSKPVAVDGLLGVRDWLQVQEIVRKEQLLLDQYTAVAGWLLKRRHTGTRPPTDDPRSALVDPLTGEVIRHGSKTGFGTEFVGGYFAATPFRVQMEPGATEAKTDDQARGNSDDSALVHRGRLIVIPQVDTRDVFVADGSDLRYYIHLRTQAATVRGVPVVYTCEFRQADFNDVVYDVPLT